MAHLPDPYMIDDENPEWTETDFALSKKAKNILPHDFYMAVTKTGTGIGQRGLQKAPTKQALTLRLDKDVIEKFKATGAGWQSRMNEALRLAQPA